MKFKKNLEDTLRERVLGLLEETMEKSWGITIPQVESNIADKLKNSSLPIYISSDLPFQEAKKKFKEEFFRNELRLHRGNISQLAKKLGLDRRSIHRAVKKTDIDLKLIRGQEHFSESQQEKIVDQAIRSALVEYKEIIQPQKMEKIYEEVPQLSRNIARILPHQHLTWKEAEEEFEKQFLSKSLKELNGNVAQAADKMGIRVETLHRKIKKLGLKK